MPAGDRPEQANKYVKRSPPRLPGFRGGIWGIRCCCEEVKGAMGAGMLLGAQKLIDDGGRCFGREGFLKFPQSCCKAIYIFKSFGKSQKSNQG